MVVRANARLIGEVDARVLALGAAADRGIDRALPLIDRLRTLLPRAAQRALWRQAQPSEHTPAVTPETRIPPSRRRSSRTRSHVHSAKAKRYCRGSPRRNSPESHCRSSADTSSAAPAWLDCEAPPGRRDGRVQASDRPCGGSPPAHRPPAQGARRSRSALRPAIESPLSTPRRQTGRRCLASVSYVRGLPDEALLMHGLVKLTGQSRPPQSPEVIPNQVNHDPRAAHHLLAPLGILRCPAGAQAKSCRP